jgi:hypothetical protein
MPTVGRDRLAAPSATRCLADATGIGFGIVRP